MVLLQNPTTVSLLRAQCGCEVQAREHRTRECGSSPRKHRFLGAAGFQWKSFAGALTYPLQLPRCRNGNAWFFGYFFFFGFFFAFGTEITRRPNVAITGLTLPTATKFCPRCQASSSSALRLLLLLPIDTSPTQCGCSALIRLAFSLRLRSFPFLSQGDLSCSVHTVEDSFSWRGTRVYSDMWMACWQHLLSSS